MVVSEAGSIWSDEDDVGAVKTAPSDSKPLTHTSADDNKQTDATASKAAGISLTPAHLQSKTLGETTTKEKPALSLDKSDSFLPSDGESTWSDSDDQVTVDEPADKKGEVKDQPVAELAISKPQSIDLDKEKSDDEWSDDDLPSKPVEPQTAASDATKSADVPALKRQESEESLWSDDDNDSIEMAAAPKVANTSDLVASHGAAEVKSEPPAEVIKPEVAAKVQTTPQTYLDIEDGQSEKSESPVHISSSAGSLIMSAAPAAAPAPVQGAPPGAAPGVVPPVQVQK